MGSFWDFSPVGAQQCHLASESFVSPFQGLVRCFDFSQGVALGYIVLAFQADDRNAPKGRDKPAQGNALGGNRMEFRIADTFTDSLTRLTGDEQKAVKTTAFDLQLNPVNPGMQFHKLDKARDKNFWSVRVNADLRLIVHKTTDSLLLCYVNHHDKWLALARRTRPDRE